MPFLASTTSRPWATKPTVPLPPGAKVMVPRASVVELEALGSVKIRFKVTVVLPLHPDPAMVKLITQSKAYMPGIEGTLDTSDVELMLLLVGGDWPNVPLVPPLLAVP